MDEGRPDLYALLDRLNAPEDIYNEPPMLRLRWCLARLFPGVIYCDNEDYYDPTWKSYCQNETEKGTKRAKENVLGSQGGYLDLDPLWASSEDDPSQGIAQLLRPVVSSAHFWSSTGSHDTDTSEYLLFTLKDGNAARVSFVEFFPYQATYQQGYPCYPPKRVRIWIGMSVQRMVPASDWIDCFPSASTQTFLLKPGGNWVGKVIGIELGGRVQKQIEDMRYYVCLGRLRVWGEVIDAKTALALSAIPQHPGRRPRHGPMLHAANRPAHYLPIITDNTGDANDGKEMKFEWKMTKKTDKPMQ